MNIILGIDTGGTYTDSVLLESDTKKILYKAKTLTTKANLRKCISQTFYRLPEQYLPEISMVCLSTTLATNAIVENHGCREGLILIGKRPKGKMPTDRYVLVEGLYDIKGRQRQPVNREEIMRVIESFRGQVDAVAISGYASIRNPAHENTIAQLVRQELDVPVVCAHELTSTLGYYERTVTCDLNARLIPLVCDLIDSVRNVMEALQVQAPLMIVKGDGSLMTDACARNRPIETILSGPAASVMGGVFLSGRQDAFIMDIGGTTTDIANVSGGQLKIRNEGAKVGNWYTHVRAAEVFTSGLGGDSRIYLDGKKQLRIGPEKSIPYCAAADLCPDILDEIGDLYFGDNFRHFCRQDDEAYQLVGKLSNVQYSDDEKILIEVLRYVPHTLSYLEENVHLQNLRGIVGNLLKEGVIARISMTPTDALHCCGDFEQWGNTASDIVTSMMAAQYGCEKEEFIQKIRDTVTDLLARYTMQAVMYFDSQSFDVQTDPAVRYFLEDLYFSRKGSALNASYRLDKTIVAIGAPAWAWAKKLGERMGTEVIIPEHAEVANAVGAAVGKSIEKVEVLIRMDSVSGKYVVYSPICRRAFPSLEEATAYAEEAGEQCILRLAENREYRLENDTQDMEIEDLLSGRMTFIERMVTVTARFVNCGSDLAYTG